MQFEIVALTPIVTGDKEKENQKLILTGLLGSLRYQYWLLKAMEAWQKNTSAPSYPKMRYDIKAGLTLPKLEEQLKIAGPVVQLFGDTGWKKLFRLQLIDPKKKGNPEPAAARPIEKYAPYHWQFTLEFTPDRRFPPEIKELIDWESEVYKLMAFVHHFGWLGSAPQNGFGLVSINPAWQPPNIPNGNPIFAATELTLTARQLKSLQEVLNNYYRSKLASESNENKGKRYRKIIRFINANEAPPIGYEIRRYLKSLEKESPIFGKPGEEKNGHASHIHVTHPIKKKDQYLLRLRFCSRPDERGVTSGGANPQVWVEKCKNHILKSKKSSPPPTKKKREQRPMKHNPFADSLSGTKGK